MIVSPGIVSAAKSNGSRNLAKSAQPGEPLTQVNQVVELLAESTQSAAQPGARKLLEAMSSQSWQVIRGAHVSPDDRTRHVTIAIGKTRYHLRIDQHPSVFDITVVVGEQTQRPAMRKPWVAPGN